VPREISRCSRRYHERANPVGACPPGPDRRAWKKEKVPTRGEQRTEKGGGRREKRRVRRQTRLPYEPCCAPVLSESDPPLLSPFLPFPVLCSLVSLFRLPSLLGQHKLCKEAHTDAGRPLDSDGLIAVGVRRARNVEVRPGEPVDELTEKPSGGNTSCGAP